jgi:ATP-dependent Clp protease ATP-binding subunit ClpA
VELIETVVEIGKLFKAIEAYESIKFQYDEGTDIDSKIYISNEDNNWVQIISGMKKNDAGLRLSFSDGSVVECAARHRLVTKNDQTAFANEVVDGDAFTKASGEEIYLLKSENTLENVFYDFEVKSPTHLYQTENGIIHHNTESARQLAKTLGIPLIKFDMSEYMEKHAVSKLIGSPPGYVGFGDGAAGDGLLINAIENNQSCVLLLDEIEKAHEDLFNILLQVMDDAKLTSGSGKTVKFNNVYLLMTTNAGVIKTEAKAIGFGRVAESAEVDEKAIKRLFKPEFRNRLDAMIHFNPLQPEIMIKVVDKFIDNMNVLSALRNVTVDVSQAAKEWLATKGYDRVMGARPLTRVIDEHIKKPLSREMLFGSLKNGGTALVTLEDDALVLTGMAATVETGELVN